MNAPLDALAQHAENFGDRTAVVVDASGGARPSTTSFAELNQLVNQLAHGLLATGARPGERLVWCGPNSLEVLATIHAARASSTWSRSRCRTGSTPRRWPT